MDLAQLKQRVNAASGPDREIDAALATGLVGWCLHPLGRQRDDSVQSDTGRTCLDCGADSWGNTGTTGQRLHDPVRPYTASLDAALALVERVLPGWLVDLTEHPDGEGGRYYSTQLYTPDILKSVSREHVTRPLALLSALLAALIAQQEQAA